MSNKQPPYSDGYTPTTTSADYESWAWYRETLRAIEQQDKPEWQPLDPLPPGQPLPVTVGVNFCFWMLDIPEIRDILFRRFVQGNYDNMTEAMLIKAANFHFLHSQGYSVRHFAALSVCWRITSKIITGEISAEDPTDIHSRLLQYRIFFTATKLT